jgi:hypothetical protein
MSPLPIDMVTTGISPAIFHIYKEYIENLKLWLLTINFTLILDVLRL